MARYNSANDVDPTIEIYEQFKARIALIRLDGDESGTGFLVAEKLLLTAQHVVETSAGIIADPHSIEVTFGFWYRPHMTSAETGDTVPVVEVVHHSPPTENERSATRDYWEASDQYLDYAILQLQRRSLIWSHTEAHFPFAPPILRDGETLVSHVANILQYLGPAIGLAPRDEKLRPFAAGLQLTITDLVSEAHDTHHPISTALYYEDQKDAAKARSSAFLSERMPKYLGYFERVLSQNPAGPTHSVGDALNHVDLSLFQVREGLRYAFPRATADFDAKYPHLAALASNVAARPRIAAYLNSPRRLPFNEFRRLPALSGTGSGPQLTEPTVNCSRFPLTRCCPKLPASVRI